MKKFSFAPTLTLKGRKFKGPRGWSGKPSHPPLTDIPIAAYIIAAGFDVVSTAVGDDTGWAAELWHAGTWLFIAGAVVSAISSSAPRPFRKRSNQWKASTRSGWVSECGPS